MPYITLEQANAAIAERRARIDREQAERAAALARKEQARDARILQKELREQAKQQERQRVELNRIYYQLAGALIGRWRSMWDRCRRDPHYIGRIKVCPRWESFQNFWADMRELPFPEASLGRINNDADYSPENCRWESPTQQAQNKRSKNSIAGGVTGVNWDKSRQRWVATGMWEGKQQKLYSGKDYGEAVAARQRWEVERDLKLRGHERGIRPSR